MGHNVGIVDIYQCEWSAEQEPVSQILILIPLFDVSLTCVQCKGNGFFLFYVHNVAKTYTAPKGIVCKFWHVNGVIQHQEEIIINISLTVFCCPFSTAIIGPSRNWCIGVDVAGIFNRT